MGWFDDSDDEEERRRPPMGSLDDLCATSIKERGRVKDGNTEEDPLDAYMKTLSKTNMTQDKASICNGMNSSEGRLDVKNEDEATSHWEGKKVNKTNQISADGQVDPPENDSDNSAGGIAHRALHNTFQKASDQHNVDIKLQRIEHDRMNYSSFQKCLLAINGERTDKNLDGSSERNTPEGQAWRRENNVKCIPPTLDPIYDFAELRDIIPDEVLEWNLIKNLTKPTLVQGQTLGVVLCGKDAIVTASTGSGKTLSYLWPIVSHLAINRNCSKGGTQSRALVLVPTRELALQVEQIARSMFAKLPLTALAITGGNMGRYQLSQKLVACKPHCVIATPGRLLDVLSAQQKSKQDWLLPNITFLVLDEADKMIQMGFANQVTQVLQSLRPDRQSMLVSATFDKRLQRKCEEWMLNPFRISVGKAGESSKHVTQHVICLPDAKAKLKFLKESLATFAAVGRTIVFCATRQGVVDIAADLRGVVSAETLHGDRHLTDRKAALKSFTKGNVNVLIATDVAGRGLDVPQVSTIINFDPAKNWDTHVHRIGRAGRLSATEQEQQKGSAYTLLLPSNVDFAKAMIRAFEREGREIPTEVRDIAARKNHNQRRNRNDGNTSENFRNDTTKNDYYGPVSKRSRF